MAPLWFKTVTRETWDDNNFLPSDYAVNPILGLRLWRWAAEPELHVWVRYLCEFYAQDISLKLDKVSVPTLILKPGLEGNFFDPGQNYMYGFCHQSWERGSALGARTRMETVPNCRACMWLDQPEEVDRRIESFLSTLN
jgi:pimeloyl-ACP methyl ester carboxylesterase